MLHYLDALVYPSFPPQVLSWGAIGVCVVNLALYAWRYRRHERPAI